MRGQGIFTFDFFFKHMYGAECILPLKIIAEFPLSSLEMQEPSFPYTFGLEVVKA